MGVVTTLSGTATGARATLHRLLPLRFKDEVFLQEQIRTAEKSIVRVLLGGKALVTAREISVLTITETPGRSTIELACGKIAVAVARHRRSSVGNISPLGRRGRSVCGPQAPRSLT